MDLHSGGMVAIEMAKRHPEIVDAIALQGVMTKESDVDKVSYKVIKLPTNKFVKQIFRIPGAKTFIFQLTTKFSKDYKMSDPEAQKAMLKGVEMVDRRTGIELLKEIGKDLQEEISQVKCPVILIDGDAGILVPFENTQKIGEQFHRDMPAENPMTFTRNDKGEVVPKDTGVVLRIASFFKKDDGSKGVNFGEQGHTVVNSCPEALAVLVHKMSTRLLRERK